MCCRSTYIHTNGVIFTCVRVHARACSVYSIAVRCPPGTHALIYGTTQRRAKVTTYNVNGGTASGFIVPHALTYVACTRRVATLRLVDAAATIRHIMSDECAGFIPYAHAQELR